MMYRNTNPAGFQEIPGFILSNLCVKKSFALIV